MMKRKTLLAGVGLAFLSSAAFGGFVQPQIVDVDTTNMTALGDMVTARYSENVTEHIGCGIRVISDGGGGFFTFGFCQAEDRDGDTVLCTTFEPDLLDAMKSSGEYGFITFNWDVDNECTRIGFSNQSFYLPEKLKSNE